MHRKVNSVCQALLGLGYIMKNRGDEAITELCKLGLEQEEEISRIICIPEVARLVIVAALAHRPRNFLEEQLLKGKRLQRIVETAPKLKQIVRYFLDAEYGEALKCWKELEVRSKLALLDESNLHLCLMNPAAFTVPRFLLT